MLGPSRRELARQLERERTRNQAREAELVNQILYLSGRTWTVPPAEVADEDEQVMEPVFALSALDVLPNEWGQPPPDETG